MKKVIVLLGLLSSVPLMSYAETVQNNPAQGGGAQPAATEQSAPADSQADKMQAGSGDEVDTINEADPSKDKDPEAGD